MANFSRFSVLVIHVSAAREKTETEGIYRYVEDFALGNVMVDRGTSTIMGDGPTDEGSRVMISRASVDTKSRKKLGSLFIPLVTDTNNERPTKFSKYIMGTCRPSSTIAIFALSQRDK